MFVFHRRDFLSACAVGAWSLSESAGLLRAWAEPTRDGRETAVDVAVIGGGLGGCAAALAALRQGRRVLLSEETDWIGGQLTSQAVPPDEHPWIERFGCTRSYRRLRDAIRDYYRRCYPLTDSARSNPQLNPGGGGVSRLCCEPRVALAALTESFAPYLASGRLTLRLHCRPVSAVVEKDRVRSVTLRHAGGSESTVVAPYFIDATELGDLLPMTMARSEYVTGAESQAETGEPHAPARANPANMQAITCCFALDHRDGEDHTIAKPAEYDFWRDYTPAMTPAWPGKLLSWSMSNPITLQPRQVYFDPKLGQGQGLNLWLYRRIISQANHAPGSFAGDATLVNWPQNDYWLGNICEVPPEEAAKHLARAKQLSLSLVYWMQTEAPRLDGKQGWPGLRLRNDLVGTDDGLAKTAYVRESRRIQAESLVTEWQVGAEARMKKTGKPMSEVVAEPFPDSVGVGSYRIDLHPSTAGDNYIDVASLPFQVPLGALIPARLENLLPGCKNLGVTHIANGCYRLHPVEWNIGEAAGALAAHCLDRKLKPRAVRDDPAQLAAFQAFLKSEGFELEWPLVRE